MSTFIFNNERYVLRPVICEVEAAFSHLSYKGNFGRFSQLGHLDLLHMAPVRFQHLFIYGRIKKTQMTDFIRGSY